MQLWEILFKAAVKQLKAAKLPISSWTFGGGTALMLRFNHRQSKDIDIFLDVAVGRGIQGKSLKRLKNQRSRTLI
jgi:hypothetical protein